jgi:peptidoglycan biosynthesis protein MviN/MurJ (putative lipid II flippase)
MASTITILSAVGTYLSFHWDNNGPFIVVAIATAATCFFGLLFLTQTNDEQWQITEETMRTAIAGTIVVVYLVLVGTVAFFVAGPKGSDVPAITHTMVTSFTTIVGIVIAFYFGTTAYVQAQREKMLDSKTKATDERGTPAAPSKPLTTSSA